ncbi:MAG: hypothetical protein GY947_06240 [Rhodobacteraceae bacterium]|nr:hypothetical protein [Paracoccaceae bacterium]
MEHDRLNRSFSSYVLTQTSLVLIVLAASHILTGLLADQAGIIVSQIGVSFVLVGLSQVPIAIMYARSEVRMLTPREGWILGFIFVILTLVVEFGLQFAAGRAWPVLSPVYELAASGKLAFVLAGAFGFLIGIVLAAFAFKTLFQLAINKTFKNDDPAQDSSWLNAIPGIAPTSAFQRLRSGRNQQDHTKTFRHMLIAANAVVIGLSLAVFGWSVAEILMLSIPLSLFFAIVCVANTMAKSKSRASILKRSWNASCKILPLTATAFMMLGLSKLYATHVTVQSQGFDLLAPVSAEMAEMAITPTDMVLSIAYVAAFFAVCLAVNVGLLALFSWLIRPVVRQSLSSTRPKVRSLAPIMHPLATLHEDTDVVEADKATPDWTPKTAEILAVLARIQKSEHKTLRPNGIATA